MGDHAVFKREGNDVHVSVDIPFATAVLGGAAVVPTLAGEAKIKVSAGTQPGDKRVIRGKGIKHVQRRAHGDQYIHFKVTVPKEISSEQRRILEQYVLADDQDTTTTRPESAPTPAPEEGEDKDAKEEAAKKDSEPVGSGSKETDKKETEGGKKGKTKVEKASNSGIFSKLKESLKGSA